MSTLLSVWPHFLCAALTLSSPLLFLLSVSQTWDPTIHCSGSLQAIRQHEAPGPSSSAEAADTKPRPAEEPSPAGLMTSPSCRRTCHAMMRAAGPAEGAAEFQTGRRKFSCLQTDPESVFNVQIKTNWRSEGRANLNLNTESDHQLTSEL